MLVIPDPDNLMTNHRFTSSLSEPAEQSGGQPRLFSGFMAAPSALMQQPTTEIFHWQCQLYHWAFQRAQDVVERSWIERDVLAVWN
jgi:hypothetical protein